MAEARTGTAAAPGEAELRARLAAVHITPPRAESVVIDLCSDPPLARGLVETALLYATRIVEGAGAAMLAARARRGVIAVRAAAAHKSIRAAIAALGATTLTAERVPDVWPSAGLDRDLDCRYAWVLDAESLFALEAAAFARPRIPRRVTIAGDVASQRTIALDTTAQPQSSPSSVAEGGTSSPSLANGGTSSPSVADGRAGPPSIAELVALAGGATVSPWVALDGGPWGGTLADPDLPAATTLVLVLPAAHPLIARARVSVEDQLRRAASACEGCRACTEVCPPFLDGAPLEPHAIIAALATGSDRAARLEAAAACLTCGVCTAACPSALDPAALLRSVKSRLPADLPALGRGRGAPHPDRATRRLSTDLLLLRAGLATPAATQQS